MPSKITEVNPLKKFMFMPSLLLVVWLAVGVVAQGDTPPPPPPPGNWGEDPTRKSADDKLAEIGNTVPGFGGMFIDPANPNVLRVFLTDTENTTQKDNAETAIREKFPGSVPSGGVVAVQGQYTLSQLTDWYKKVIEAVVSSNLDTSKLVGTDLEEDKNRVEIAVKDEAAVAVVEAAIAGLADVPRDAVRITIRGGFRFRTSVQDRIRPLAGGIQLQAKTRAPAPSDS